MFTEPPLNPYADYAIYPRYKFYNCETPDGNSTFCPYVRIKARKCSDIENRRNVKYETFNQYGYYYQPEYSPIPSNEYLDSRFTMLKTNCQTISTIDFQPGNNIAVNNTILIMAFLLVIPAAYASIKMISRIRSIWSQTLR